MNDKKSFESTYSAYPFPVLVDFGLALGNLFVRARRRQGEAHNPAAKTAPRAR